MAKVAPAWILHRVKIHFSEPARSGLKSVRMSTYYLSIHKGLNFLDFVLAKILSQPMVHSLP